MNAPLETLRREMRIRDEQLDMMEGQEDKKAYLTLMRDHMRGLLASGAPYVTANDAREFYETLPHPSEVLAMASCGFLLWVSPTVMLAPIAPFPSCGRWRGLVLSIRLCGRLPLTWPMDWARIPPRKRGRFVLGSNRTPPSSVTLTVSRRSTRQRP
jgi:hypothetical protein